MIKIVVVQLALSLWAATLFGQKFTTVEVSTTTPLREALRICKNVGELGWFYSLDYDEHTDSFSILMHPHHPTIKIEISASMADGKTTLALTLCEAQEGMLHTGAGGYMTRLKAYTKGLTGRLENIAIGEYREGKGLAIPPGTGQTRSLVNRWGEYPINKTDTYPSGVYEFYETFRRNQIEPFGLNVRMTADSLFEVSFTDSLPDDNLRARHWLHLMSGRGVLSFQGNLYFMIEYPSCVPLVKRNDTFYFHIPHSMPGLYYLDQAREAEMLAGAPQDRPNSVGDLAFDVLGYTANSARAKKLLKKGLTDPAHRDCYIDLDTGEISFTSPHTFQKTHTSAASGPSAGGYPRSASAHASHRDAVHIPRASPALSDCDKASPLAQSRFADRFPRGR